MPGDCKKESKGAPAINVNRRGRRASTSSTKKMGNRILAKGQGNRKWGGGKKKIGKDKFLPSKGRQIREKNHAWRQGGLEITREGGVREKKNRCQTGGGGKEMARGRLRPLPEKIRNIFESNLKEENRLPIINHQKKRGKGRGGAWI